VEFSITLVIVILTCLVSIGGFTQQKIVDDLIFYPPAIHQRHQYYRFITHGLIHADLIHLAFNMLALYSFGVVVEKVYSFDCIFGEKAKLFYLLLYFLGMIMASLPDYFKYRESYQFKSLGASGAVSAVIFSTVVFFPQNPIGLFFIPVQVPGFVFAILYLAISVYLDKRGGGRVNHSAHFWGAAFGIAFTLVFCQVFANGFNVYDNFMQQLHSMKRVLPIECDY
jgi:membrane associated rhomboid family serine protease